MFTFDPDARRARINRPGGAPIDGQLVCYYPCPRCSNPARALVYLGESALVGEVVAQAEDVALNGGHGHWDGRDCHLSLWTEPPAALARAEPAAGSLSRSITFAVRIWITRNCALPAPRRKAGAAV
jgi:hypothetical protein